MSLVEEIMNESLNTGEIYLLKRLAGDLNVIYANSTVMPENRADCEAFRRDVRDRLKSYQEKNISAKTLLHKAIMALEAYSGGGERRMT